MTEMTVAYSSGGNREQDRSWRCYRADGGQIRATESVETVERGTLDEARCAAAGISRQLWRNMNSSRWC